MPNIVKLDVCCAVFTFRLWCNFAADDSVQYASIYMYVILFFFLLWILFFFSLQIIRHETVEYAKLQRMCICGAIILHRWCTLFYCIHIAIRRKYLFWVGVLQVCMALKSSLEQGRFALLYARSPLTKVTFSLAKLEYWI